MANGIQAKSAKALFISDLARRVPDCFSLKGKPQAKRSD
jgi:hypothetical protein